MGRSFHQPGMVNENVLESDFEPLCDGTTRRRSLVAPRDTITERLKIILHLVFYHFNFKKLILAVYLTLRLSFIYLFLFHSVC